MQQQAVVGGGDMAVQRLLPAADVLVELTVSTAAPLYDHGDADV
jgi:hypothetical protein